MNEPKFIIVHCSDSPWGCCREVRKWHIQRGWTDVGYHFLIQNGKPEPGKTVDALDGAIECGRSMNEDGAHCLGYNKNSFGVCLIGEKNFTIAQFDSLKDLLVDLCRSYGISAENILGHGETDSGKEEGKTCPNFDVNAIRTYIKGRL